MVRLKNDVFVIKDDNSNQTSASQRYLSGLTWLDQTMKIVGLAKLGLTRQKISLTRPVNKNFGGLRVTQFLV
jgi:hypothetical protein